MIKKQPIEVCLEIRTILTSVCKTPLTKHSESDPIVNGS